jgi:hypothetical protein
MGRPAIIALIVSSLHLTLPIIGILWFALRQERQRLERARQALARQLMMAARGRRRH